MSPKSSSVASRECVVSPSYPICSNDILTDNLASTLEAADMGLGRRKSASGVCSQEEHRHLQEQRRLQDVYQGEVDAFIEHLR